MYIGNVRRISYLCPAPPRPLEMVEPITPVTELDTEFTRLVRGLLANAPSALPMCVIAADTAYKPVKAAAVLMFRLRGLDASRVILFNCVITAVWFNTCRLT